MKLTPMMLKLSKLMAKTLKNKSYIAYNWLRYTGDSLAATNGHWLIQSKLDHEVCTPTLLAIDAAIPAYELHEVESGTLDDTKGKAHKVYSKPDDGVYPVEGVNIYLKAQEPKASVCFDREYLIQVLSLYDCKSVRLTLNGELDPLHIYSDDTHAVIMPMKKS